MATRPSNLSRRPIALDIADGRGDVLGDVMSLGLLRNAQYKQVEARAPWGLDVKERNRALLYLIARGTARLELAGRPAVELATGHVAFLPRGAPHVLRDSAKSALSMACDGRRTAVARVIGGRGAQTSIIAAFFDLERRPPLLMGRPSDVVVLTEHEPHVAATMSLVLTELASPGPASILLLQRLADVLVVQAMRSLAKQPACRVARRPGLLALSDPPIQEALSLMHTKIGHPWTVAELATRVALSRSGFAARFTELVSESPLQYLARWRMTRAAEMLRDTRDAVSSIATRVGYESTPSFNKAFKRWQGASPGEYRRAQISRT